MGMRYFWQMLPSSVEADGNGALIAGIYARRANVTLPIYAGVSRSCETRWSFFNTADAAEQRSRAMGACDRLYALASPFWYTRRTHSITRLVEKNQAIYSSANWSTISGWEINLISNWNRAVGMIDNRFSMDSYGLLSWGDAIHYTYSPSSDPWRQLWDGNYYGLPQMAFMRFLRTGDRKMLEFAIPHAEHVQDVHTCHFGTSGGLSSENGSSRYCPAYNHVANGINTDSITTGNPSHHKTEGMFTNYYLTGNDRSIDIAIKGADWMHARGTAYTQGPGSVIDWYIRRWSHQMFSLVQAYSYTKDTKYYNNMVANWNAMKVNIANDYKIGAPFMMGFFYEAMINLYHTLKSPVKDSIPHYLKVHADKVFSWPTGRGSNDINSNVTLGYAFLSTLYGSNYLNIGASKASTFPSSLSNQYKDMASFGRSLEMAMYYYAMPESLLVTSVEGPDPSVKEAAGGLEILLAPMPASDIARIRVPGWEKGQTLRIFDLKGQLVSDLTPGLKRHAATLWQTHHLPTGIYMIRLKRGKSTVSRRMVLLR
jgi:hypothetical protein